MAKDPTGADGPRDRLDFMIREFREARQRRLVRQGISLWNRTEANLKVKEQVEPAPPRNKRTH